MKTMVMTLALAAATMAWGDIKIVRDIPYRPNSTDEYARERCKLDLKYPDKPNFRTVVWFHGGGLTGGNGHFIRINDTIAQVAVNYRLMGKNKLTDGEECIRDAAAAIAWTLRNIATYGGDTNQVYVSGMSAGGYLTMMAGMAPQYLGEYGYKPTDLAGLAAVSGQATKHFAVRKFAGDKDPQYLPKIDRLAPLNWVSKDLPPIICICGQAPWEWKCRSEENRLLIASCTALGHERARFVELNYCDHGRTFTAGVPFVEMFVEDRLPGNLQAK